VDAYFVRIKHVVRPQGTPALYSRAHSSAAGAAKDPKAGVAVNKAVAHKIITRITARIADRIPGVAFKLVQSFDHLPALLRTDPARQGGGKAYRAYYSGVIYIVLDSYKAT
jgi:hypothetical protein